MSQSKNNANTIKNSSASNTNTKLNKNGSFLKNNKLPIIIISVVIIVIIIAYFLYKYFRSDNPKSTRGTFILERINSDTTTLLTTNDIIRPLSDDGLTYSFWLNIRNFYDNHLYWKHIMHKGTPIRKDQILNYEHWENLESDLPDQCPGLWIHPYTNTLRIAITTITKNIHNSNQHAHKITAHPIYTLDDGIINDKTIEVCDIENIAVNTPTNFIIVIANQVLTVYMKGKIKKTCILKGKPLYNDSLGFMNQNYTFNGDIRKFTYIPLAIKPDKIDYLYNDKPSMENDE